MYWTKCSPVSPRTTVQHPFLHWVILIIVVLLWDPTPNKRPLAVKVKMRSFSKARISRFGYFVVETDWLRLVNSIDNIHESAAFFQLHFCSLLLLLSRAYCQITTELSGLV